MRSKSKLIASASKRPALNNFLLSLNGGDGGCQPQNEQLYAIFWPDIGILLPEAQPCQPPQTATKRPVSFYVNEAHAFKINGLSRFAVFSAVNHEDSNERRPDC